MRRFSSVAIANGAFSLYEDDGTSNAYLTNGFAATTIACQPGPSSVALHIAPIQGGYDGKLTQRRWKLRLHLAAKPAGVRLNGKAVRWKYDAQQGVLLSDWKAATAQASEILIAR